MGVSKTSDHIQIKVRMPNPNKQPLMSSNVTNKDLKDMDVLCIFKIKTERQNFKHEYIKDQWPYPNQDQDAKPQSGNTSPNENPKSGLKGHGCSFHLQNQDRELKSKNLIIRYQWPYKNPYEDAKPQSGAPIKAPNHVCSNLFCWWSFCYRHHIGM